MLWVTAAWGACFVAISWGLRDAPVLWFAGFGGLLIVAVPGGGGGGTVLALVAAAVEGPPVIAWTTRFVAILAFLALIGTAATFVAWFTETRRVRLDVLSAWTFLTPVFGIGLSAVLLAERPSGWTAVGLFVSLTAMWMVLRPQARSPHPVRQDQAGRPVRSSVARRGLRPWTRRNR